MFKNCRSHLLSAFAIVAVMMFAGAARADCDDGDCDPYLSHCSDSCMKCTHQGIDDCDRWRESTCGEETGACLADNCTPNWQETSRVTQGTYDGNGWFSCTHHTVQKVTETDSNHCNVNSSFYSYTWCDDFIDGSKSGTFNPSCCDGHDGNGNIDLLYTCNSIHNCY